MKRLLISLTILAIVSIGSGNVYADQNFVLCVSTQFSKGITLEYNSGDSGCVVDDHTNHNFSVANKTLVKGLDGSDGFLGSGFDINTTTVGIGEDEASDSDSDAQRATQLESEGIDPNVNASDFPQGHGPVVESGIFDVSYTVVFESAHKVLGIVAKGNCNIRSERAERVSINVLKNGKRVSSFTCYHPDDLSNTYCQQTEDSDSIGIAFSEASSVASCPVDEDTSGSVSMLVYPTN